MKNIIHQKILFVALIVLLCSCSSFGTISSTYDSSQERIWEAINIVVADLYTGVEGTRSNPPTVISKLKLKDKEFGLDKSSYQAFISLNGFKRPFIVDAEVRVYPEGEVSKKYETDMDLAAQVQQKIREYIKKQEEDFSFKKSFSPY